MPTPARPRRLPPPPEREVQRAIMAYLRARGILAWRSNVGGARLPGRGGREQLVRFGVKGGSDLQGVLPGGKALFVECKRPGRRPTPAQVAFMRAVGDAGAVAFWADSVDVVARVLDAAGAGCRIEVDEDGGQVLTDEEMSDG